MSQQNQQVGLREENYRPIERTVKAQKALVRKWLKEIPDCVLAEDPVRSVQRQLLRDVQALCDFWHFLDVEETPTKLREILLVSGAHPLFIQELIAFELSRRKILKKKTFFKLVKTKGGL